MSSLSFALSSEDDDDSSLSSPNDDDEPQQQQEREGPRRQDVDSWDNDDDDDDDDDGGGTVVPEEDENDCNNDFFADSPYFDAFVEKEMFGLEMIIETMKDVASKAQEFAQTGSQMALSTQRLARSCRLLVHNHNTNDAMARSNNMANTSSGTNNNTSEERRRILGADMVDTFDHLGDVLEEMASAQEHLCRFFKAYLVSRLENVAAQKIKEFRLREEATKETEEAEYFFNKYLNEGKNPWGVDNNSNRSSFEGSNNDHRYYYDHHSNSYHGRSHPHHLQTLTVRSSEYNINDNSDNSVLMKEAVKVARWKHDLMKMRIHQISAECKRYQLSKYIVESKFEVNNELSSTAVHIINEMDSYHTVCSNIVRGLLPKVKQLEEKCRKVQDEHKKRDAPSWQQREKVLLNILTLTKQSANDAYDEERLISRATSPQHLDMDSFTYDIMEENTQLWDLPSTLASYSGYRRPAPPGVIAEGWLYEQQSSNLFKIAQASSWNRCWVIVRKDGIFALQPSSNTNGSSSSKEVDSYSNNSHHFLHRSNNVVKVKICDVRLCTVREYRGDKNGNNDDPTARFCFELIVPGKYLRPRIFQARGPQELKMWLNAIRSAMSAQFASGADNGGTMTMRRLSEAMNMNTWFGQGGEDEEEENQECSEIRVTVMERGRSLFNIVSDVNFDGDTASNSDAGGVVSDDDDDNDNDHNHIHDHDDYSVTEVLKKVMDANRTCADCRRRSPDWASLNLGVVICLECSGVHRSLGVHISKVRSLMLDSLSKREAYLLLSLGNARVNRLWENEIPKSINSDDMRRTRREEWIERKYARKEFIGSSFVAIMNDYSSPSANAERKKHELKCNQDLYEASKRGDVMGVAKALVLGGNVNWKNLEEENKSALHVCGQNQEGMASECIELLLQNGAAMEFLENYTPSTTN